MEFCVQSVAMPRQSGKSEQIFNFYFENRHKYDHILVYFPSSSMAAVHAPRYGKDAYIHIGSGKHCWDSLRGRKGRVLMLLDEVNIEPFLFDISQMGIHRMFSCIHIFSRYTPL